MAMVIIATTHQERKPTVVVVVAVAVLERPGVAVDRGRGCVVRFRLPCRLLSPPMRIEWPPDCTASPSGRQAG
jgi:hypothetical protein